MIKSAVSFTKEILIENLNFLCRVNCFRILRKFFGVTFRHILADTALGNFPRKKISVLQPANAMKAMFLANSF